MSDSAHVWAIAANSRTLTVFVRVFIVLVLTLESGAAFGQTGGFIEPATSAAYREPLSASTLATLLPARGRFTFPAPYGTTATRLTNGTDCGGGDCVNYVGYSYWSNINNHTGSDTMLIFIGLAREHGGAGPTLFTYNKITGKTQNAGPLFAASSPHSWATGEGWYFSPTRATTLYMNHGALMLRYDVIARTFETVYDARPFVGLSDIYIWQMHSSGDDRVHSATVRSASSFQPLGCIAYREDTGQVTYVPAIGDFDECQVDKSGRWLVIKENVDAWQGEDNRIVDLHTGVERILYDHQGAGGHSDLGYGYMVAEDNFASMPGAARLWRLGEDLMAPGQGLLVYHGVSWNAGLGQVAHGNAHPASPIEDQRVCSSNATRLGLPRVNEIVCYWLDGSLDVLVAAPNMTDLDAAGGGSDDYAQLPKGNLDVTGEYFIWTSNAGSGRLDAFIVRLPQGRPDDEEPISPSAQFEGADISTKGDWIGRYGSQGYVLAQDGISLPAGVVITPRDHLIWTWAASTNDPRALLKPSAGDRLAATWYGSSFTIDVDGGDGQQRRVALFIVDWDSNARGQRIEVLDPSSGAVLDTRSAAGFTGGQYWMWNVRGAVRFRVTQTAGANAVVSGVFLDASSGVTPSPPPATAIFTGSDTATQGSWRGVYGATGYALAQEGMSLPIGASVGLSGHQSWTWTVSTSDVRALLKLSGSDRIAATWYASSFTIDVDAGDGQEHRVSLYVVDWDSTTRAQHVEVLDAATGAVLDTRTVTAFNSGQYWIWTVRGALRFHITQTAGSNAVVSAVFIDPPQ